MNELDRIFDQINTPTVVRKTVKTKDSPAQIVAKALSHINKLADSQGIQRIEIPVTKAEKPKRTPVLKQTEKRDFAFHRATGDESLGTRSARAIGSGSHLRKATTEGAVPLYSGFVSKGQITGEG